MVSLLESLERTGRRVSIHLYTQSILIELEETCDRLLFYYFSTQPIQISTDFWILKLRTRLGVIPGRVVCIFYLAEF